MPSRFKNRFAQKTIFDELIDDGVTFENILQNYLNDIYDSRVKFLKRQAGKGMADILNALDAHMVDRATHMNQTANTIGIMAERLGLNSMLSRAGMRGHDAGHPFGSHEGEQVLTESGILLNAGFFHHNAKGVDIALSERIIEKIIEAALNSINNKQKVEEIRNNPELMQKMEEDAWYFLEFIVGHDGEASKKDLKKTNSKERKFKNIKEAVLYYTSRANRTNNYKADAQTLEAVLAKPSDVISYLKTDMENAFRKGIIIGEFSEDYLECVGELLFEKNGEKYTREERIKKAREYIKKVEIDNLRETKKDVYNEGGKQVLELVLNIVAELNEGGIYTYRMEGQEVEQYVNIIVTKRIKEYEKLRMKEGCDYNTFQSEKNKIIDYTHKMLKVRKSVVEQVTETIKQELIDDYCIHTLSEFERIENDPNIPEEQKKVEMMNAMNFSPRVFDIMYRGNGLKNLNYKEYVQYSKKDFQIHSLPKAVYKTIKQCSKALLRMGVIRDKFYDRSVLDMIQDENIKRSMKMDEIPESRYERFKRGIGINEFRIETRPKIFERTRKFKSKKVLQKHKVYKDIYGFTQRQCERFARSCEDVYYAIPYTVRELVKKAVDSEYEPNQYLREEETKKVFEIRKELRKRFGEHAGLAITKENLEAYINEIIERERTVNFAENVASEIAIKYLGGFGNEAIKVLLVNMGNLRLRRYKKEDRPSQEKNKSVTRLIKDLEDEESKTSEEIEEELIEKRRRIKFNKKEIPLFVIEDGER